MATLIDRVHESGNGGGQTEQRKNDLAPLPFEQSPDELLRRSRWPDPKWLHRRQRRWFRNYRDYLVDRLRARYVELEGDFLTAFGSYHDAAREAADPVTATCVARSLERAREGLEHRMPDVEAVVNELDLVERYTIWLYPASISALERPSIQAKLESLPAPRVQVYKAQLDSLFDTTGVLAAGKELALKIVYDEIVGAYNRQELQSQIDAGLGIGRLKRFFYWGIALATLVLLAVPLVTPRPDALALNWDYRLRGLSATTTNSFLTALVVGLMGAVGGYLSGLLQAQSSAVTLSQYQQSMVKLRLRPLVGVLVSLIIYILVSRSGVAGLTVQGIGPLLLITLASGFSERYFLRLIKLDNDGADEGGSASSGKSDSAHPRPGSA
jgi:hypothetical protein